MSDSDVAYFASMACVFGFGFLTGLVVIGFIKCKQFGDEFHWQTIARGDKEALYKIPDRNKELKNEITITLSNDERYVVATDAFGEETLKELLLNNTPRA